MQVTPKDAPAPVPGVLSEGQKAAAKRESAIKAFMGGNKPQAQETPVANPSKVSPEEMSAIKPPSIPSDPTTSEFDKALSQAKAQEEQAESRQTLSNTEQKPGEATPESSKEPLSAQYAQLARKERALRAKAMELKQREEALKATKPAEQAPEQSKADSISLDDFRKNPWKYMQDAGVTYDQVTQQALNQPSSETQQLLNVIQKLEEKISNIEGEQKQTKSSWEENQKNQYQQAVSQIKRDVSQLVDNNPDFETVKATNSIGDVVELIEKTFKEDGYLMTIEDATKQVEDYLAEEAYKLSQLKKIQKRLKPTAPAESTPAKSAGNDPTQLQPSKTLSNSMTASRQLSARDRAIAAGTYGPGWREKV